MNITPEKRTEFVEKVIGDVLEAAIEWIGENCDPGDVFDRGKLEAWAHAAGWKTEDY